MNEEYKLDPMIWFGKRELPYTPPHFVVVRTPITNDSMSWILSNISGRFSIVKDQETTIMTIMLDEGYPAFEDPKEAVLFELKWS